VDELEDLEREGRLVNVNQTTPQVRLLGGNDTGKAQHRGGGKRVFTLCVLDFLGDDPELGRGVEGVETLGGFKELEGIGKVGLGESLNIFELIREDDNYGSSLVKDIRV